METNGIRRNNLLYSNGEVITVDGIQPHWLWSNDNASSGIHDFEPITITEDWLLMFGFERTETDTGGNYSYYNGVIYLHSDFSLSLFNGHSDENDTPYFSPELKYIHQLQNLYFALTGEELV